MGILLSKGLDTQGVDESGNLITTSGKSIFIHGTDIELDSVYARIEFVAHPDGSTISVTFKTYKDQTYFLSGNEIYTTILSQQFDFALLVTESQSIGAALNYTAQRFMEKGYNATVIL